MLYNVYSCLFYILQPDIKSHKQMLFYKPFLKFFFFGVEILSMSAQIHFTLILQPHAGFTLS